MKSSPCFHWLGVAGFELTWQGRILVVDPYFTRISFIRQWFGRIHPNADLVMDHLPACDYLLVTHAHYDHLMDVPAAAQSTGASVYGSANTCRLLGILGVPAKQVHTIQGGDSFSLDPFDITVIPTEHIHVPLFTSGPISPNLRPPLRARDYRMDVSFSFKIRMGNITLLTDPGAHPEGAPRADVLLVNPHYDMKHLRLLLQRVQPKGVIPNHWDDMWRPLSRPQRPWFTPPNRSTPWLKRIDPAEFQHSVHQVDPAIRVFFPERFALLDLYDIVNER
jgi:L-ascorbate metabolism protein UlaG (beta-lactamase superfamily)